MDKNFIQKRLESIILPEINKSLIEYLKQVKIENKKIELTIFLVKQLSPLENSLKKVILNTLTDLQEQGFEIKINFEHEKKLFERANIHKLPEEEENPLNTVKNMIAVASGKGGVGKSTISANLAIALALKGYKVGLLDADVYGPSIPILFGIQNEKPYVEQINGKEYIIPIEKFGVKVISIGFFVREEDALIWRGAMATSAIKQLINDVYWGDLDFFVIDLPPGTGDVPLTLVQTIPITGGIIVTTPQKVAVADVIKAISMFKNKSIEVPILGIVENMAYFTPSDMPDKKYYIFGKGGAEELSKRFNIPILAQIPIDETVVEKADKGIPAVHNSSLSSYFETLAENTLKQVEYRNKNLPPTKILKIK